MKKEKNNKNPAPREFVPTEMGSAVFVSVDGRPPDEEYLIKNNNSRDDVEDGAGRQDKSRS